MKGHKSRIAGRDCYYHKFTFLLLVDRAITVDDGNGYDRYDEEGYYFVMMIQEREEYDRLFTFSYLETFTCKLLCTIQLDPIFLSLDSVKLYDFTSFVEGWRTANECPKRSWKTMSLFPLSLPFLWLQPGMSHQFMICTCIWLCDILPLFPSTPPILYKAQ